MTTSRRALEIAALVAGLLALREITGRLTSGLYGVIDAAWANLAFAAAWLGICAVAARAAGWPRWCAWRSPSWISVLVVAGVLLGTEALYSFRITRLVIGELSVHVPYGMAFFVYAALAAPVVEELLFRGVLWQSIAVRSNNAVALAVTTALFMPWHWASLLEPSWFGAGGSTPLWMHGAFAVLMGVARWRFDAIGVGVVLHALYNGLWSVTA